MYSYKYGFLGKICFVVKYFINLRLNVFYKRLVILLYSVTMAMGVLTNILLMGTFLTNKVNFMQNGRTKQKY